jgi:sugar phosphate isomerase/epimerase
MPPPRPAFALHTWTLDPTPLEQALGVAKATGWDAVELRRLDFTRAAAAGQDAAQVIAMVRRTGLPVACVGVELGWMWADGAERQRLLETFDEQCERAVALGCPTMMSPVDKGRGDPRQAARSVREVGDIAARHGVRLAVEFNAHAAQLNALEPLQEVLAAAGHPAAGLLLDSYHLWWTGTAPRALEDVAPGEIAHVQFSDVPASGREPGRFTDRLPPGRGIVPFREFFLLLRAKGYAGYLSYEAPNPEAWARPPAEVAREALESARARLPP